MTRLAATPTAINLPGITGRLALVEHPDCQTARRIEPVSARGQLTPRLFPCRSKKGADVRPDAAGIHVQGVIGHLPIAHGLFRAIHLDAPAGGDAFHGPRIPQWLGRALRWL